MTLYHYGILHNLANSNLSHMPERSEYSVRILVTSSKGGIGKSTLSLGLALAFAKRGRRVLLCDCDLGGRCLDLLCGEENNVLFDIGDVAVGRASAADAILHPWGMEKLFFCPSPVTYDPAEVSKEKLIAALRALEKECEAEHVICDTAGMICAPDIAGEFADTALVISTQQPASIRAAENTAMVLAARGLDDSRLVISAYDRRDATKGDRAGILEIIDGAGIRCEGVIPRDRGLMLAGEEGAPPPEKSYGMQAFRNIAARLEGEPVNLFFGMGRLARKKTV